MNISVILTAIGIAMNGLGVVLVFFFALSPYLKSMEKGYMHLTRRDVLENKESKMNKKRINYRTMAVAGLLLCVIGCFLQIASLFV